VQATAAFLCGFGALSIRTGFSVSEPPIEVRIRRSDYDAIRVFVDANEADAIAKHRRNNFDASPTAHLEGKRLGLLGEFAVAQHAGAQFHWYNGGRGPDDGVDLLLYDGKRAQIKATRRREPLLYIRRRQYPPTADYLVLVHALSWLRYNIIGWISRQAFDYYKTESAFGADPIYIVDNARLAPFRLLDPADTAEFMAQLSAP
jgi:hypothetical protein